MSRRALEQNLMPRRLQTKYICALATLSQTRQTVKGINPRIEHSHVVVGCDGGDEPSDVEGNMVIFGHVRQLEPEEDCGASHTSDAERQSVVDKTPLAIDEAVWKWCHFCK